MSATGDHDDVGHAMPRSFWVGLVVGSVVMAFGVWTALHHTRDTRPATLIRWVVGLGIAHDAIVVPVALIVAAIVDAIVPRIHRGTVRAAIAVSALATALSWPAVRRYGTKPGNPSALPRPYGRNLAITVMVVWLVAALLVVTRTLRARDRSVAAD